MKQNSTAAWIGKNPVAVVDHPATQSHFLHFAKHRPPGKRGPAGFCALPGIRQFVTRIHIHLHKSVGLAGQAVDAAGVLLTAQQNIIQRQPPVVNCGEQKRQHCFHPW
ncbi:MAG: hypothetical protein WAU10_23430, partial [Caldilineaceae bacterium]